MKNAATHSGHCQLCGHLQKLPGGRLSLHGYSVTHGYFSGTCSGARELPYEQSCELVKKSIVRAQAALVAIQEEQKTWRTPATEAKAWVVVEHNTSRERYSYSGTRSWQYVDITHTTREVDANFTMHNFTHNASTKRNRQTGEIEAVVNDVLRYEGCTSVLDACTKLNAKYADYLDNERANLSRYIAFQTERVRVWAPAELLPVSMKKDKLGFVPNETAI